jgi:predicted RNA polymerase sigma factor
MCTTAHSVVVAAYLGALRAELADLESEERDDLMADVEVSLVESSAEGARAGAHPGRTRAQGVRGARLAALMEIQASRMRARRGPTGEPILLLDQDRARWDWILVGRGLAALERAEALGGALGPYALQAAVAACHARARRADQTDWARIASLYDELAELTQSPVVELNRAVAVAMAFGPAQGLAVVDRLTAEGSLAGYHLLPTVRGDLLAKLGRSGEARAEFERAAELTGNERERGLLLERARECIHEMRRESGQHED